ncbi:Taurine dioxygenase, alpha-ketoglutarate-dependent [Duganella sacchari]|uniref:Taurine dioxygenase, alpha-ketoglutarate-dependent n=1 Tax=Duganella sacchari TaxID=551987 RepID=A0A1M7R3E5_9BURK|nr:Taurine dioxygenase, alpha-ketoglutarate-dependent [Duganella sacchari]
MLSSIEYQGNICLATTDFSWGNDLNIIFELLNKRFDSFNDNGFYPHADEVALREELKEVATLRKLSEQIRKLGANGVVLRNLGLHELPEDRRNAALYALTLMLGYPTSTDQRTGRVAWDVRARPETGADGRFVTFSERVGSADMHTDSSFYPMPEEQFILYVVNAARCDGGHSILIDAEAIYQALHRTPEGAAAFELLSKVEVPFRVPAVYAAGDENIEVFTAPVFGPPKRDGDRFTMRWRYDAIMKGLAARPDLSSPALEEALEIMNCVAEQEAPRFMEQLPTDTLMLADNHRMLHGRTTYSDERRHLIRIRMSDVPNAQRIGPSGVVRD